MPDDRAPGWLDRRTVEWCADRCDALAARAIRRREFYGLHRAASHLKLIVEEIRPITLVDLVGFIQRGVAARRAVERIVEAETQKKRADPEGPAR